MKNKSSTFTLENPTLIKKHIQCGILAGDLFTLSGKGTFPDVIPNCHNIGFLVLDTLCDNTTGNVPLPNGVNKSPLRIPHCSRKIYTTSILIN